MPEPITADPPVTDDRAEFIRQFEQPLQPTPSDVPASSTKPPVVEEFADKLLHPLRTSEVVCGVTSIFLWLIFFLAGVVVETRSQRELISENAVVSTWEMLSIWFILLTSYTVTNIAILACLAAVIGKFSRRSLSYETASIQRLPLAQIATVHDVAVLYSVAVARGFVVYLLLVGGLILMTTPVVTDSSPTEYIKMAGAISIMAFMAGYDTEIFKRVLDRISAFSSEPKDKSPSEAKDKS